MSKQLNFEYDDEKYTLEFTKGTIKQMEKLGFIASELLDKPMNNLPALFEGAFLANHRNVRRDKIDEIFDNMTEKDKLLAVLLEMYNEPIENLLAEPKKSAKNIKWTATV